MKRVTLILSFFLINNAIFSQELNNIKAVDSVIGRIRWKEVKKVKLGQGRKDRYAKDKDSESNYAFFINGDDGATEYIYYDNNLIRIKYYAKNIPGEKKPNLTTFAIYKGEVVDKFVSGRNVSPVPLLKFAEEYKEEAKKVIFQTSKQ